MCTGIAFQTRDFYFGRNLDYDFSYGEELVIVPKTHPFSFRNGRHLKEHHALMGIAHKDNGYPLFYDAINDQGLGMAGLNFVGNAVYAEKDPIDKEAVASFEIIPFILLQASNLEEAKELLRHLDITSTPYNEQLPPSSLHWLIADKTGSLTVERTKDGLHVYDNPVGALTNNPPFPIQLWNLKNYASLSVADPENKWNKQLDLSPYSRGMGAMGLPGDLSSLSRFVRVCFTKTHSICQEDERSSVSQFFHILGSVEQVRGCCEVRPGEFEYTIYSICYNASKGIAYLKTYDGETMERVSFENKKYYLE